MMRVSGKKITGRKDKWLGIDMYEPEFGEDQTKSIRVPDLVDLTGIRLFVQMANNIPVAKRNVEHMRIASKALDKLEPKVDEGELSYVDLEDTAFNIIYGSIEEILPRHLIYGIHIGHILDQINETAKGAEAR